MTFMLILLAIAVGLSIETIRALFHDGRSIFPPASHLQDSRFVAPGRQVGQPWPGGAVGAPALEWSRTTPSAGAAGPPPDEVLEFGHRAHRRTR